MRKGVYLYYSIYFPLYDKCKNEHKPHCCYEPQLGGHDSGLSLPFLTLATIGIRFRVEVYTGRLSPWLAAPLG